MTSIRKIKQRIKARRPCTYTMSCWVKMPGENWKNVTQVSSSTDTPRTFRMPLPEARGLK